MNTLFPKINTYDSTALTGIPNAVGGYSSGEAMLAMQSVAADQMLAGDKYEWTDSSFEERKSGNMAPKTAILIVEFAKSLRE